MTGHKAWRNMVVGGTLLAAVVIQAAGAAGQTVPAPQPSPPIYAIPLKDGRTAQGSLGFPSLIRLLLREVRPSRLCSFQLRVEEVIAAFLSAF